MSKKTVDDIPLFLQPFYWAISWLIALAFYGHQAIFRLVCRIEYVGKEHVERNPSHIFCIWHENLPLYFITHARFQYPNIWIAFPLWYMKPIHLMEKMIGIKELAFGASGHGGRAALEKISHRLRQGWSTFLTPDGPKGPLRQTKNGVLLMSMNTGTPIIPISFQLEKKWRIPSWDRKRYPWPFSKIVVVYAEPEWVKKEPFEAARRRISIAMNDPEQHVSGTMKGPAL